MRIFRKDAARVELLRAFILSATVSACGKTSNDLSAAAANDPRGSSGSHNQDASNGMSGNTHDAGASGGAGPDASASATSGGAPTTGGSGGASNLGGVPSTGGSGGLSNISGAASILDPHAEERRQLAGQACSLGDKFPCLTINSDANGGPGTVYPGGCLAQTEASSFQRFGTACWEEWAAHMQCGIDRTDYCPCTDGIKNYCIISPALNDFGNGCLDTKHALDACEKSITDFGTEKGTGGEFYWLMDPGGVCTSRSVEGNVVGRVRAECSGSPAGGQNCLCYANDHVVVDLVDLTLNGGAFVPWTADSCRDVAMQLAAGKCTTSLSCCFRYDQKTLGGQTVNTCGCGSDPSRSGYASCDEFAAAANGTRVDACVEWQASGDFPIAPKLDGG